MVTPLDQGDALFTTNAPIKWGIVLYSRSKIRTENPQGEWGGAMWGKFCPMVTVAVDKSPPTPRWYQLSDLNSKI